MSGYLLLLLDPLCFFAAAWLATQLCVQLSAQGLGAGFDADATTATWAAALLSPFFLFDRRFVAMATLVPLWRLMRAHGQRLLLLALLLFVLATIGAHGQALPAEWIAAWLAFGLVGTSLVRVAMVLLTRRLAGRGHLTESVAVVGAGAVARRFVDSLLAAQPRSLELLGVYDDEQGRASAPACDGTIADLLALGMARRIDWIVLTLPPGDELRVRTMVHRLKALSAPIALCPQAVQVSNSPQGTAYIGLTVPIQPLMRDVGRRRDRSGTILPRWLTTLADLAGVAGRALVRRLVDTGATPTRSPVAYRFDGHDLESFAGIAAGFGADRYGYAVTPNADHLIRLRDDADFRRHYAQADHVLLDSRFVAHVLRATRRLRVPVCTGSDLTARLFTHVIAADDGVVLIGASAAQAQLLRTRHGLQRLAHFNPPMGFIDDPQAVEACLQFIESHSPFRFCLLAVGSPQQESIAALLRSRGRARGLALCIGASIDFLTGRERRAPTWMQAAGVEWLYRLVQAPRRMARRYLVRGPRIFHALHGAEIELRPRAAPGAPPQLPVLMDAQG
jgi:exopolysaccharide biosynthesis WecB/TagA/CpsF family protein